MFNWNTKSSATEIICFYRSSLVETVGSWEWCLSSNAGWCPEEPPQNVNTGSFTRHYWEFGDTDANDLRYYYTHKTHITKHTHGAQARTHSRKQAHSLQHHHPLANTHAETSRLEIEYPSRRTRNKSDSFNIIVLFYSAISCQVGYTGKHTIRFLLALHDTSR